jgi:hypothetical protein
MNFSLLFAFFFYEKFLLTYNSLALA